MRKSSVVTSVTTQVRLPESTLERFFNGFKGSGVRESKNCFGKNLETMTWCSAETRASGIVQIVFARRKGRDNICAEIPVSARFLVTGIKTGTGSYKVTFGASLS